MNSNDGYATTSSFDPSPAGSRSQVPSDKSPMIELDLLEEVKSPFETEAETTILHAIEQAEKRRSSVTITSITDRDKILKAIPAESLHLFGEDFLDEDESPPQVFSLRSIDEAASNKDALVSPMSNDAAKPPLVKFSNAVKKVQMVQSLKRAPNRRRMSSYESGEASVVHTAHHSRVPSRIPATPPTNTEFIEMEPQQHNTTNPANLFDIVNRMGEMTRQATMRHVTAHTDYSEVPTNAGNNNSLDGNDYHDPESLVRNEDLVGTDAHAKSKRDSKRATALRQCCLPLTGFIHMVKLRKTPIRKQLKLTLCLFLPLVALAFILFYPAQNPDGPFKAKYSWWCLFIVRQGITFTLAKVTQFVVIDYMALETSFYIRTVGRLFTLMLIQAKGWPFLITVWALYNFALNYGTSPLAKHWFFWIRKANIFQDENYTADIVHDPTYLRILLVMVFLGLLIMVKRLMVSLLLGKKKYVTYGPPMEKIMRKILLIAEVGLLADDIDFAAQYQEENFVCPTKSPARGWLFDNYQTPDVGNEEDEDEDSTTDFSSRRKNSDVYDYPGIDNSVGKNTMQNPERVGDTANEEVANEEKAATKATSGVNRFMNIQQWIPFKKSVTKKEVKTLLQTTTDSTELVRLLGEWEEPEFVQKIGWGDTSIHKILHFRESLKYLDGSHPLSVPFGLADTRKSCCISAQKVYSKLLKKNPGATTVHFDTIALLALDSEGKLHKDKARALIRLFRPDREGYLTELDFLKSCDHLYKRARMFRATTLNSAQIDDAFEGLINTGFYIIVVFIVMVAIGLDTSKVLSVSTVFISLSFLIGSSASRYLEGVLLVLARQPYDVGDRIAISNPQEDTSCDGSLTWYVESISLFQTTVRLAATNEVASYSNSSLAHSRIINAARSPRATTYVYLKFGIDIPYSKVMIFKSVVEKFVKERPREFSRMNGFRAVAVEADCGYIKYVVALAHMESWQNIGIILQEKADVSSFCLEVSKKMGMRFIAPPMPIDLSLVGGRNLLPGEAAEIGLTGFPVTEGESRETRNGPDDDLSYDLPPRIPVHVKNDSLGYQSIADMFAKGAEKK